MTAPPGGIGRANAPAGGGGAPGTPVCAVWRVVGGGSSTGVAVAIGVGTGRGRGCARVLGAVSFGGGGGGMTSGSFPPGGSEFGGGGDDGALWLAAGLKRLGSSGR